MIILTRTVASRELVERRCAAGAAAGVTVGMDLAHARSLLPPGAGVHVEPHRPDRDEAALRSLACWGLRYSPLAAPDAPDGLLIDVTGTERLHHGEGRLLRGAAARLRRMGFGVRIAAAGTFGCAWAVARFGRHELSCVPNGREREAIEPLPTLALRLDEPTVEGLAEIGITEVGHVLKLPRGSLAPRFDGSLLRRLLQGLGEADERIDPVRPAPPLKIGLVFDGPTDQWESVEAAVRQVLEEFVGELTKRQRAVRRLDVELLRPRDVPTRVQIDLSRASRSIRHLWTLLRSRLERVDLGEGVEGVVITGVRTARLVHEQLASRTLGADDQRAAAAAWGELVDTLAARLGVDHVLRVEPVESHLPEQAFRTRTAMAPPTRATPATVTCADRPTTLFARPEEADAMALTPDGPVLSLGWRARRWSVTSCTGPERLGQEWWRWQPPQPHHPHHPPSPAARRRAPRADLAPPDRDYFIVQLEDGRRLWMFRHAGTSRWFVHGEWS